MEQESPEHKPRERGSVEALIAGSSLKTLKGLAAIIAPTSLVTGLIYYFGWVRTSVQATYMGLDATLFGYSTTDYLLLGAPSMFWPIMTGLLVGLALLLIHGGIKVWLRRAQEGDNSISPAAERRLRWLIRTGFLIATVAIVVGIMSARDRTPSRFDVMAAPVGLGAGVVLVAYGTYLYLSFLGPGPYGGIADDFKALRVVGPGLVMLLLFLMMFWGISKYFGLAGVDFARLADEQLAGQPSVVVYSPTRLQLAPPVVETELGGDDSQYRFSYSGLKLMFRAEDKLFLRPSGPGSNANIVIPESSTLRFEFSPGDL